MFVQNVKNKFQFTLSIMSGSGVWSLVTIRLIIGSGVGSLNTSRECLAGDIKQPLHEFSSIASGSGSVEGGDGGGGGGGCVGGGGKGGSWLQGECLPSTDDPCFLLHGEQWLPILDTLNELFLTNFAVLCGLTDTEGTGIGGFNPLAEKLLNGFFTTTFF